MDEISAGVSRTPANELMSQPHRLVRNISYSVAANLVSFLVGVAVVLLVPKLVGVEEYGYFQLFLFFIGYVGFFHFGWADGIILRYAGERWEALDRARFSGQIHCFLVFEIALWGLFCLASWLFFAEGSRLFVLLCTGAGAVMVLANTFLRFILQATNRIREYAVLTLLERLVYLVAVLATLAAGGRKFEYFILAYLLSQAMTLVVCVYFCRALVFARAECWQAVKAEARTCVIVGSKLMVANVASFLILGVLRFGIERAWGVVTFGKVSLLLSVVSILFVFVNAVSTVLLPALRGESMERLKTLYLPLRCGLSWLLLAGFACAWPLQVVAAFWLPAYSDVLQYLPLVLPVCLYESLVSLVTGTYLKVLRMEKDFLWGNCWALAASVVFLVISIGFLQSLPLAVLSMPAALAVRLWVLEARLSKQLNVPTGSIRWTEAVVCTGFVAVAFGLGGWQGMAGYVAFLAAATALSWRSSLKPLLSSWRLLLKRN